jgi:hypothetical protein
MVSVHPFETIPAPAWKPVVHHLHRMNPPRSAKIPP